MVLRSIENTIGNKTAVTTTKMTTRNTTKKGETTTTTTTPASPNKPSSRKITLLLSGSIDRSDSELEENDYNELSSLFSKVSSRRETTLSSQVSNNSSSSQKPVTNVKMTRKRMTKRVIDDDDDEDNNKENIRPPTQPTPTTPEPETVEIVIASSYAPSGSSIKITKRVKLMQANLKNNTTLTDLGDIGEDKHHEDKVKLPRKMIVESPAKNLLQETPTKNFDYFLQNSTEKNVGAAAAEAEAEADEKKKKVDTATTTKATIERPKRRSAQKAMSKVLLIKAYTDNLDLEDVDSEQEDKSIQKKYNRPKSNEEGEVKLFESQDQEESDDEADYKSKKSSKGRKRPQPKPKSSVIKSATKKPTPTKTKSKRHHYDALNDDKETEKQLQEAAKEYNEIKNYKLIVEHHANHD